MRDLAMVVVVGWLAAACSQSAPRRDQDPTHVGRSSEFLDSCSESCPEPLSCVCGVCTVACTSDGACTQYSGNATCVGPSRDGECQSMQRSCDVPCTHDQICERLEGDFVCVVGRCRHRVAEPQEDGGAEDDGGSSAGLAACMPHASIAGLCILPVDDAVVFTNCSPPLQAKIVAIGKMEARTECFGSENFGAAIPVAAHPGEQPVIPEETVWWRVENEDGAYTVGLAASGAESLGARIGDSVSIRHGVVWGDWDSPRGNAEVDVAGRGHALIAINDSSLLNVSDGAAYCERSGACGGQEWTMRIEVDGDSISVPPFESMQLGKSRFTNAGAFTHRDNYMEADETTEGTPGCKSEPRSNFVATRVDAL